jgi:hypothetical protein
MSVMRQRINERRIRAADHSAFLAHSALSALP